MSAVMLTFISIFIGWLLALATLWIGICIGLRWKPKENVKILRPWKKMTRRFAPIAGQAGGETPKTPIKET